MKFENTSVCNFENAFRGMRNPLESWDKSDSKFGISSLQSFKGDYEVTLLYLQKALPSSNEKDKDIVQRGKCSRKILTWLWANGIKSYYEDDIVKYDLIGPRDMDLALKLIHGGSEHRKFLRQILVSVDITAPMYWWSEFDTYKVGTVANSTSKMHKITSKPITAECFEITENESEQVATELTNSYSIVINMCEELRQKFLETEDRKYWRELIRWLPVSWLQTRTVTMNYENILTIYNQRKNHRLTEWNKDFCGWVEQLPYANCFFQGLKFNEIIEAFKN